MHSVDIHVYECCPLNGMICVDADWTNDTGKSQHALIALYITDLASINMDS